MLEHLAPTVKKYHKYQELVDAGIKGILFGRPRKIFGCEACIYATGVHTCENPKVGYVTEKDLARFRKIANGELIPDNSSSYMISDVVRALNEIFSEEENAT